MGGIIAQEALYHCHYHQKNTAASGDYFFQALGKAAPRCEAGMPRIFVSA
jgi:hypothetical protein